MYVNVKWMLICCWTLPVILIYYIYTNATNGCDLLISACSDEKDHLRWSTSVGRDVGSHPKGCGYHPNEGKGHPWATGEKGGVGKYLSPSNMHWYKERNNGWNASPPGGQVVIFRRRKHVHYTVGGGTWNLDFLWT